LGVDEIELEEGRPRTEAYIVYLFLMLRGYNGGCKDQHARLRVLTTSNRYSVSSCLALFGG
jgi:hypothetical protein